MRTFKGVSASGAVGGEGLLADDRGLDRGFRRGKRGAERVADRLEDGSAGGFDRRVEEGVVASQRDRHGARLSFPETGAPFDIGEEEGDDLGLQVRHERPSLMGSIPRLPRTGLGERRSSSSPSVNRTRRRRNDRSICAWVIHRTIDRSALDAC